METDPKTGVTTFYTHCDKYGLQITRTSNAAVIAKLSGVNGKKEKYRRKVLDKDGNKTDENEPDVENVIWTDEDGVKHGNGKKYRPIDKPIHKILAEPDDEIES